MVRLPQKKTRSVFLLGRIRDGRHAVRTLHVRVHLLQQRVRRRANVAGLVIEILCILTTNKYGCVRDETGFPD